MMIKTKILPLLFILLLNPILAIAGEWEDLDTQVSEAYSAGEYDRAAVLAKQALKLAKKIFGRMHPNTLDSMNNLALLYKAQGRYEQAEPLYTETLALKKEILGLKHPATLLSMNNLAALYQAQGRYEQAEPLYTETLALRKEILGLKHPRTLTTMSNLAGLYQATQQWKQAQTLWDEYLSFSNQFLNQVLWGAGEKTRVSYIQQQKPLRNIILSFYSHLLANSSSQYKETAPFSDFDPKQISQQAWRVSISRKGLLLRIASEVSALSKIHQSSNPQLIQLSEQIKHVRSQLATLAFSAKPNPKQQAELEELLNTLQRQLGAKVSSFRNKVTNVSPEHILSALKAQQAIVDFMVFKEIDLNTGEGKAEQIIALLAVPNQGVQLIKLGALEPISQLIQSYRSAIEPNPYNDAWFTSNERKQTLEQTSKALYQKLWQPLIHALGDKQQVFLIPDGILHLLPFKALQDEQGQYLNQKIQITRLGSAREIVIPPLNNKTSTSTIFANPVYAAKSAELSTNAGKNRTVSRSLRGLEFSPLPGTKTESDSIQQTLQNMQQPVKLYSQLNATEMAIRQEKSPRILHIATHGFFLENIKVPEGTGKTGRVQFSKSGKAGLTNVENPLARSGLALTYANQGISGINQADGSDGILTAMEVLNLQLEGTELVTLSACNTGVGEISVGEGVYSLNRAFQEAGAKAVLSTLWSISDEGTNHFMQKFYHRFLNNQPPQQALQETQDELKDSKKWQDPFYWAPFVMMGQ